MVMGVFCTVITFAGRGTAASRRGKQGFFICPACSKPKKQSGMVQSGISARRGHRGVWSYGFTVFFSPAQVLGDPFPPPVITRPIPGPFYQLEVLVFVWIWRAYKFWGSALLRRLRHPPFE